MHNEKPVAIVLGGTVPHCELIRQLKDRGYYTILVDYLQDSPGKHVADEHIQESTLDQEMVLQIAHSRNASLVISGCVDQANISACYSMEKMGLYVPYSYETALRVTNKGQMKQGMLEAGIPTSKYISVDNETDEIDYGLRYPVIVKPADSNSANGVKRANTAKELRYYLADALKISRNHRAIVEEFISGQEISAYCFIKDGKAKLLMTAERISVNDGPDNVIKCYASIAPARISKLAEERAEEIASMIASAFGLNNTPLFFQGIVTGDDISVIEFAPRVGGGSCFKTIKGNTEFDIISAVIDSWLNIPVSFESWSKPSSLYVVNTVYGKDGVFDHIEGEKELLENGVIEDFLQIRVPGDKLDNSRASSSRVCFLIIKANDKDELLKKVHDAYDRLVVYSSDGLNLIRKDLNLYSLQNEVF